MTYRNSIKWADRIAFIVALAVIGHWVQGVIWHYVVTCLLFTASSIVAHMRGHEAGLQDLEELIAKEELGQ